MPTFLDSFMVDQYKDDSTKLLGLAKSMNTPNGDKIETYDLRFCYSKREIMGEKGIHTLEHLFASYMRDHLNRDGVEIIDISPMGAVEQDFI